MLQDFTPRLYQETILATAAQKNTLVVLPTGLGKTIIAVMLVAQRFVNYPNSKALIIAPTRPLCEQHVDSFKKHLHVKAEEIVLFTGQTTPMKRAEHWKTAKVIVSTPQGLENDVITNRISLEDVSCLVVDEAHRATGDYAYVFLAKQYEKQAKHERILGLTASPGDDLTKITDICQNLYIEEIELRTDEDPDVKPYVQEIDIQWAHVNLPDAFKDVHKYLKDAYTSKLNEIKKHGYVQGDVGTYSKTSLLKMQGELQGLLARGERDYGVMKSLSLLAEATKLQHALELVETQGSNSLLAYLEKLQEQAKTTSTKAVQNLVRDINFRSALIKTQSLVESNTEHPKLAELKRLLAKEINAKQDIKIIIFNQYRDQASTIQKALGELGMKSKIFVGQMKKKDTGMSQKEQKAVLQEFRDGLFNCLIATSVAEEGLDIPQVDLVVFYEPIPSAIRTVQRRGRTGRSEKGRVIVLMTKGTRDEGYRWSAHHKEKRMHRTIRGMQNKLRPAPKKEKTLQTFMTDNITIYADYREKGSGVIKQLIDMGVTVNMQTLAIGDYLVSERVAVEYKTVKDFIDSIIDGRLLTQMRGLKKYERPVLLIEGEEDVYAQRNMHPNAIRGMLASIAVDFGIPILRSNGPADSAALLAVLAKREAEAEKRDPQFHTNKPTTLAEAQEYLVSALPGIGPALAKPLLQKFKQPRKLFTANEERLQKVELIGPVKAKKIRELLDTNYQHSSS